MDETWKIDFTRNELEMIVEMFDNENAIHPLQGVYEQLYNRLKGVLGLKELDGQIEVNIDANQNGADAESKYEAMMRDQAEAEYHRWMDM